MTRYVLAFAGMMGDLIVQSLDLRAAVLPPELPAPKITLEI
jgi:hypothetical protein